MLFVNLLVDVESVRWDGEGQMMAGCVLLPVWSKIA